MTTSKKVIREKAKRVALRNVTKTCNDMSLTRAKKKANVAVLPDGFGQKFMNYPKKFMFWKNKFMHQKMFRTIKIINNYYIFQ